MAEKMSKALIMGTEYDLTDADAQGKISELKSATDALHNDIYPNGDAIITEISDFALDNTNINAELPILTKGHRYRIFVVFSANPSLVLSTIRTATGLSGSTIVDDLTSDFDGESWTDGKQAIYTPTADNIKYLRFGFLSSYTNNLTCDIKLYDYDKAMATGFDILQDEVDETNRTIDGIKYKIDLDDAYNLLPPTGYETGKMITAAGVVSNHETYVLSDYVPIAPSMEYICNWAKSASIVEGNSSLTGAINCFIRYNFAFFDSEKKVIPFTGDTNAVSKAIPSNAAYIRVTITSINEYPMARLIYGNYDTQPVVRIVDYSKRQQSPYEIPNTGFEGFKMVMFGDSITHGSLTVGNDGVSYVDYANDYLHSDIVNVGFGGTRMTYTLSGAGLFCFYNLIDCIVSDNANAWDALDVYVQENNTYAPHLAKLKTINWESVDAIGLMYGANDFTSNTPVGSAYNEDVNNYDGACAYALKKLLTKYPHLQILILAPFDRELTLGDSTTMTDVSPNTLGLYMSDYAESLKNVQSRFHCPIIETGKLFGINAQTILMYAPDGTHPRANIAQKRIGWLFAQAVRTNLAPYR